jgi:hypothetical protein
MNLGHISWAPKNATLGLTQTKDSSSFSITTGVSLRLDCPAADAGRRASVRAFVQQVDSRYVISLDGTALSTAPALIDPMTFCGSTTQHTFVVRVPVSSPAGPVGANIGFQVTLQ